MEKKMYLGSQTLQFMRIQSSAEYQYQENTRQIYHIVCNIWSRSMHFFQKENVFTASEFWVKKWDILVKITLY